MCIAIPSPGQRDAGTSSRWWRWPSSSPARILGLSAALQLVGLALSGVFFAPVDQPVALMPPLFVALSTLLLGFSSTNTPQRLGALPFSHPLLVTLFATITAGGLLALFPSWTPAGQILVLAGWLIALRSLWWKLKWAPKRLSRTLWFQFGALVTVAAALGTVLLVIGVSRL